MYFDTHAHLNFAAFVKDREKLAKKCLKQNVWLINVGTNFFTSQIAVDLAQKFDKGVYAAVGLHPINLATGLTKRELDKNESLKKDSPFEKEFDYERYRKLAQNKKVVAIGEIGLDYYYKPKTKRKLEQFKENQEFLFIKELKLAKELELPIILHCRMAHQDMLRILRQQASIYNERFKGVVHCFTGSLEQAQQYLEMGFLLGFNGIIFKLNLSKVIKKTSLDKMLLETDCPYLPPPKYKDKRNDPLAVKEVAKEVAKIKDISLSEVATQTSQNSKNLFLGDI